MSAQVNNPGRYVANFSENAFVERAKRAAVALLGTRAVLDYEQLLEKRPQKLNAAFPMHADMHYWPRRFPRGAFTKTATFSLAVTDADESNGCLRVLPGSGRATRRGRGAAKANARAVAVELTDAEAATARPLPVRRGDVTIHDEWILHGSGGNPSDRVRKTYVVAFRDRRMVDYERSVGFAHSYNDDPEVIRRIRAGGL